MPPTHPQEACGLPESAMAPHTPAPLAPHPNHLLNSPSTMPLLAHSSLLSPSLLSQGGSPFSLQAIEGDSHLLSMQTVSFYFATQGYFWNPEKSTF